jgi:hypothetical protein
MPIWDGLFIAMGAPFDLAPGGAFDFRGRRRL